MPATGTATTAQPKRTITRTFEAPVLRKEHLGDIPEDRYQPAWGAPWDDNGWGWGWGARQYHSCNGRKCNAGSVGVYREVPVYLPDGSVKMKKVTETLTEEPYNPGNRSLVYSLLGGAAGLGAGALGGVLTGSGAGPVGMAVGAALGAAAGFFLGRKTAEGDRVEEVWVNRGIYHPEMHGYYHTVEPDYFYDRDCDTVHEPDGRHRRECHTRRRIRGYWHRYEPAIEWSKVGEYRRPTLQHTAKIGPVAGGALAVGAGGLAGLAAGALLALM